MQNYLARSIKANIHTPYDPAIVHLDQCPTGVFWWAIWRVPGFFMFLASLSISFEFILQLLYESPPSHKVAIPKLHLLFHWLCLWLSRENWGYLAIMSPISELPTTKLALTNLSVFSSIIPFLLFQGKLSPHTFPQLIPPSVV